MVDGISTRSSSSRGIGPHRSHKPAMPPTTSTSSTIGTFSTGTRSTFSTFSTFSTPSTPSTRTAAPSARPAPSALLLHLDHRGGRPAEHFGLVHLFRVRRRRPIRSRRRGADDVGEDVAAFAQPRGEQQDAVVVPLDVIEAARFPPAVPDHALAGVLPILLPDDR